MVFLFIVVVILILILLKSKKVVEKDFSDVSKNIRNKPKRSSIVSCDSIMRSGELRFFRLLGEALPGYHIFPQVSFNVLITHAPHIYGSYVNTVRRKFHHKFVDFVICDRATMKFIAVVEYDGSGHNKKNDAYRDEMLRSVGYRVERFSGTDTLDSIRTRFGLEIPISTEMHTTTQVKI